MPLDSFSFQKQISKNQLFTKDDLLLLAVSGGMDSMALTHLLQGLGYKLHIAHVNFGLRSEESEADEKFVRQFAEQYKIPFHIKRVEPDAFDSSRLGVQETARNIRYTWFKEIADEIAARYIVLAHHKNDQSETILHQFLRGGMLRALSGMRLKHENLVRPLLPFSRDEIASYAKDSGIEWRDDSSNNSSKYTRNFIRLEVVPMLKRVNENVTHSLANRAVLFSEIEQLVEEKLEADIKNHITAEQGRIVIPTPWFSSYPFKQILLWHLLEKHHFSSAQMSDVLSLLNAQSGSFVESATHQVYRDRESLLIVAKTNREGKEYLIESLPFSTDGISISEVNLSEVHFGDKRIQYVDYDKISFPLLLRPWQEGDKINPLGMKGTQKVSDILIQQKVALTDKSEVMVIQEASGNLLAILGRRISEPHKISDSTTRFLRIAFGKSL